jgi:geranylgeranyl diphosphate synthase, type II
MAHDRALVERVLADPTRPVLTEIERVIADRRGDGYAPLYDYPFREGKGLRPAILLSACRAAGGTTDQGVI